MFWTAVEWDDYQVALYEVHNWRSSHAYPFLARLFRARHSRRKDLLSELAHYAATLRVRAIDAARKISSVFVLHTLKGGQLSKWAVRSAWNRAIERSLGNVRPLSALVSETCGQRRCRMRSGAASRLTR
jgi:hypothetical protein